MMSSSQFRFIEQELLAGSSSVNIQELGSEEDEETVPLLHRRGLSFKEYVYVSAIAIIVLVGMMSGVYLLSTEVQRSLPLNYVKRTEWSMKKHSLEIPTLKLPAENILLTQTNSSECVNAITCTDEIRKMQEDHSVQLNQSDIVYNFLIGGDGRVYEGRGWTLQSKVSSNNNETLIIAFIGEFTESVPTEVQLNQVKALLRHGKHEGKIVPCYNVVQLCNPRNATMQKFLHQISDKCF